MTVREVCEIMNFEYWVLTAVAMALGVPFARLMNQSMNAMVDMDMMSMPSTLPPGSYIVGVAGCVLAVLLTNYSAKRRIRTFDMVEVLKERE
jgi:ABC-type antimicrobial peptide transport system permease subunit